MSRPRQSDSDDVTYPIAPAGISIGTQGVDLRTSPRNRNPESLGELLNATFRDDKVAGRRPGHLGYEVRSLVDSPYKALDDGLRVGDTERWALGHGAVLASGDNDANYVVEGSPTSYPRRAGGIFRRESETVVWTGDRLLTLAEGNPEGAWFGGSDLWTPDGDAHENLGVPAVFPHMETAVVPTNTPLSVDADAHYDGCVGMSLSLAAWTVSTGVRVCIRDRATGSVFYETTLDTGAGAGGTNIKCVYSSGYLMAYWALLGTGEIVMAYAPESDPTAWSLSVEASSDSGVFDVEYISQDRHAVVWDDSNAIKIALRSGPNEYEAEVAEGTTLESVVDTTIVALGVAVDRNSVIGLIWQLASGTTKTRLYEPEGTALAAARTFTTSANSTYPGVTISARWMKTTQNVCTFVGYANCGGATDYNVRGRLVTASALAGTDARYNCLLASRAFRVGNDVGVWLFVPYNLDFVEDVTDIVPTALALIVGGEEKQQVRGFAEYGTSYNPSWVMSSVRPDPAEGTYGFPDEPTTRSWHMVTAGRRRTSGAYGTMAEMNQRSIDMVPDVLRSAQYGRSTYIAGAALQVYDGLTVTEVGFINPPNPFSFTKSTGGGDRLTLLCEDYKYRVYAVWQNAQGEMCRSPAYTTSAPALTGTENTYRVDIRTLPFTNKRGVTFEVYRNEGGTQGTTYYYVGSVAATDFATAQYVSYTDSTADTDLATSGRPVDPHNPAVGQASELEEVSPPGCTIVVAHQDRLWLAGGDCGVGNVVFSKLKEYGEQAGFSDLVGSVLVADDSAGITSLAGMNEGLVAFQSDKIRFLQGAGPDNLGNGYFPPAATVMGPGATSHEGTCPIDLGIVYWSGKGPQLLTTGLQVANISSQVEPLASTLTPSGVAAPNGLREVRWYTRGGTALLWDYQTGSPRWATWSGLNVAGVALRTAGRPDLAMTDGFLFREDADTYRDGGGRYEFAFTTGEQRPSDLVLGSNMLERIGLFGVYEGPHRLRVLVAFNGEPLWDERFTWDPELDLGATPLSEITDTLADYAPTPTSPDGVYRFVRRVRRNPMSTVRLRFSDGGPNNASFSPHEVLLEMGANDGVARVPVRRFDDLTDFTED